MSKITFHGMPVQTIGSLPSLNVTAPDFIVTKTDLSDIHLKNYIGNTILLNIFPSLDTPVCANSMVRFNEMAEKFKSLLILCISADLPFAQQRFCTEKHLENVQPVS